MLRGLGPLGAVTTPIELPSMSIRTMAVLCGYEHGSDLLDAMGHPNIVRGEN